VAIKQTSRHGKERLPRIAARLVTAFWRSSSRTNTSRALPAHDNDYTDSGEILLDQSEIANLLGLRRVGVSAAARELRSAPVVRYSRGCISILDTAGLGKKSCECYRFIRKQYKHLRSDLPRLLTR
jgi:hypothetical protein